MTILIFGGPDDDHAAHMLTHLRSLGHDAEYLDSRDFPAGLRIAHDPAANAWTLGLPTGRVLPPGSVRSIYWRCYNGIGQPPLPDAEQAFIAGNDARSLFESLLIGYPARWVNGWKGYLGHQTKPVQFRAAASLGADVPATLLTNDAEAVRAFAAKHPRCIFKPVQGVAHTVRVTPRHLSDANLGNLKFAPVTLQEEIVGTNVRVFVAGERVLACEVRADTLDFRDTDDPAIVPHDLPPRIADQSRAIARALDYLWTGIDYRLTPEGRYAFLEANPSPMFRGFESRCGLPLTAALTDLLTEET